MTRHVALTGFMAAGKSTIGKRLARKLGVPFVDLDDAIAAEHGPIPEIFERDGEAQFREYERAALERALADPAGIIALGGGAVTYDPTLSLVQSRTYSIFLRVAPEQALSRLRRSRRRRPLAGREPSLRNIRELYEARLPRYLLADCVLDARSMTTAQIVETLAAWIAEQRTQQ